MRFLKLVLILTSIGLLGACETPVAPTFSVNYLANGATGGSVPHDATKYEASAQVRAAVNTGSLVRTGYTFVGWNTASDGSGSAYAEGSTFSMSSGGVDLFASWSKAVAGNPTPPEGFTVTVAGPSTLAFGQESMFTAGYDGTAMAYRWMLNGSNLPGATASTLTITPTVATWTFGANLLSLWIEDANGVSYSGNLTVSVGN